MSTFNQAKRAFIVLNLFWLIQACNSSDQPTQYQDFKKTIRIKSALDTIHIPPVLWKERQLITTEKYLISLGADKDTLFRVFDHTSGKYLGGFGKKGDGPGEFKLANASSFYGIKENSIYIGDLKSSRVIRITDNPEYPRLTDKDITTTAIYKTPAELIPLNSSILINDSIIAGKKSFSSEKQLAYFNVNDRIVNYLLEFPSLHPEIPQSALSHFYYRHFAISRDQSKIVSVYGYLPLLSIYDIRRETVKEILIRADNQPPSQIQVKPNKKEVILTDAFFYYQKVKVSNKHIYARFEEGQFGNSTSHFRLTSENQLHVFNLEGKPIVKILLEGWMQKYAITPDDKYLYFWHPEVENRLFRFPLSQAMN